jgi:hypothetical protein
MTISSPTFQRLQSGIKAADDLRVKEPINAMMAWLSGDLVTQLNTHFGAVSNSISARIATLLATANTWTAAQTFTLGGLGAALTLRSSDSTASAAPDITIDRESNSPAANDNLGRILFNGRDNSGVATNYARITVTILDPVNGSEDGQLQIINQVGGADVVTISVGNGVQIGSPTGGYQGAGTLNLDNALFRDGTQVVSSRVTGYGDPFGAISRATFSITTVTTAGLAAFVAAMYTDLKAHGMVGN